MVEALALGEVVADGFAPPAGAAELPLLGVPVAVGGVVTARAPDVGPQPVSSAAVAAVRVAVRATATAVLPRVRADMSGSPQGR